MQVKSISEGSKLEIIDQQKNGNKHTYYSVITNIIDANTLEIQAPLEKGVVISLDKGKDYECYFISLHGLFRCQVGLESRYREGGLHFLRMKIKSQIVKHQRREFYRLDDIFDFRYFNHESDQWQKATSLDISGSGIRCIIHEDLAKKTRILCDLNFEIDKKGYHVSNLAEVIETRPLSISDKRYESRWMFVDIPSNQQDIIIKYIYDEQRRRRKKESR